MKTILVATDFSPAALNAAMYAADLALSVDAGIHLLHVFQLPVSYTEIPVPLDEANITSAATDEIALLKSKLEQTVGTSVEISYEIRTGAFFHELEAVCRKLEPYLVVMGSQGSTAAERILFGSHAIYAMKHLHWPLMTVPPAAHFGNIRKVGLACDFRSASDTLPLEAITRLINSFQASLIVINMGRQDSFDPDVVHEAEKLQEKLKALHPGFHFLSDEDVDEGILEFAKKHHLDLLIVLPKYHSPVESIFHKSHTKQLVLHSEVPVIALH